jgi:hypothetical protein
VRAGELGTDGRPNEALSPDNRGANGLPFEALFAARLEDKDAIGLPFGALFDARNALFGPIPVVAAEPARKTLACASVRECPPRRRGSER